MPEETVTLKLIYDKLSGHDQQFETISAKLSGHDQQFEAISAKLSGHGQQFEAISTKLSAHDQQFANTANYLLNLRESVQEEFAQVNERFKAMDTGIEKLNGDLESLEQEYHMITVALKRIEGAIQAATAPAELEAIKGRLTQVEDRLLALESR